MQWIENDSIHNFKKLTEVEFRFLSILSEKHMLNKIESMDIVSKTVL